MGTVTITNCDPSTCGRTDCPLYTAARDGVLPIVPADDENDVGFVCNEQFRAFIVPLLKRFAELYALKEVPDGAQVD